jgi:ABC-2 type transport system permease protein
MSDRGEIVPTGSGSIAGNGRGGSSGASGNGNGTPPVSAVITSTALLHPDAARVSAKARILDRGYRPYEGRRRGRIYAARSVIRQSFQRCLGIRRPGTAKVFPIIAVFIAYVPAIVFIGTTALIKDKRPADFDQFIRNFLPGYGAYYGYIVAAIVVFVGFVAPEVLCTDRRNGLLGMYLSSPLNRDLYLLAKAVAVALALVLVTLGPPLLYLVGLAMNGRGPDGVGGFAATFGKIAVAGVVVALINVALSFAVSSTTTRRAAASAAVIFFLVGSWVVTEALVSGAQFNRTLLLLDVLLLPLELAYRIFGTGHIDRAWADLSTPALVAAYVVWTAGFAAFTRIRYQRIKVTR